MFVEYQVVYGRYNSSEQVYDDTPLIYDQHILLNMHIDYIYSVWHVVIVLLLIPSLLSTHVWRA